MMDPKHFFTGKDSFSMIKVENVQFINYPNPELIFLYNFYSILSFVVSSNLCIVCFYLNKWNFLPILQTIFEALSDFQSILNFV